MKKYQLLAFVLLVFLISCKNKAIPSEAFGRVDMKWIDPIVKNSDSSYIKNYYRKDIVTATYYISKKDSGMLEIMKDSLQNIKRFVLTHNQIMKRSAKFYDNGQLITDLLFHENGRPEDNTVKYYSNIKVKAEGLYRGGVKVGKWKQFLDDGKETVTIYDSTGIIIRSN